MYGDDNSSLFAGESGYGGAKKLAVFKFQDGIIFISNLLTVVGIKGITVFDRALPADFMQQLIAQMALDKSRQMAEVTPVIFFDKL